MRVFIIVPSLTPSGPVKGAVALANGLVDQCEVSIVSLKRAASENVNILSIRPEIKVLQLGDISGWLGRLRRYKEILGENEDRNKNISLSFCFSADIFNYFVRKYAVLISSVRGNLTSNYRASYGRVGLLFAALQYLVIRTFDEVVAMSESMIQQLKKYGFKRLHKIGNFIDEARLETRIPKRIKPEGPARFVFIGRLVPLKSPQLLIDIIKHLKNKNIDCCLDIVGDGPLYEDLNSLIKESGLENQITMRGHVEQPYELIQQSDCFILPSVSEGISRAVLESLFIGVPCVLRDIDAAREIIQPGINGELFVDDADLIHVVEKIAVDIDQFRRQYSDRDLLPVDFHQSHNVVSFMSLFKLN